MYFGLHALGIKSLSNTALVACIEIICLMGVHYAYAYSSGGNGISMATAETQNEHAFALSGIEIAIKPPSTKTDQIGDLPVHLLDINFGTHKKSKSLSAFVIRLSLLTRLPNGDIKKRSFPFLAFSKPGEAKPDIGSEFKSSWVDVTFVREIVHVIHNVPLAVGMVMDIMLWETGACEQLPKTMIRSTLLKNGTLNPEVITSVKPSDEENRFKNDSANPPVITDEQWNTYVKNALDKKKIDLEKHKAKSYTIIWIVLIVSAIVVFLVLVIWYYMLKTTYKAIN